MNVKLWLLIFPFVLLFALLFYFIIFNDGNYVDLYVKSQKGLFLYLNGILSKFAGLQFNLTQLGDVLISFSLLSVFIVCAPKMWEALLTSALFTLIVSAGLKKIFSMPRPAAMYDNDSFVIIGKVLTGRTSLPSGHSIAAFMVITILLFAFMPRSKINKFLWTFVVLVLGGIIAFSRVGVGAHYPLDVIIGSTIGFIIGVVSIIVINKKGWFSFIGNNKYYPFFMIVLIILVIAVIFKIKSENLFIYYLSLMSLLLTLYFIIVSYVKK